MEDAARAARAIIDASRYMILATADAAGGPWASPVYFAHDAYRRFIWVSRPERRHSLNIAVRPEIAISIFDSTQRIGSGHGVQVSATAAELAGPDRDSAIEAFSRRSVEHGGVPFTLAMVEAPAAIRLYQAVAVEQFVVLGDDNRLSVEL